MLKHSVMLKFNNVEMLKSLWKNVKNACGEPTEVSKVAAQPLKIRQVYDIIPNRRKERSCKTWKLKHT